MTLHIAPLNSSVGAFRYVSFEEQKVAKQYLVLLCEAQLIQPMNLLYLKQLIEYLFLLFQLLIQVAEPDRQNSNTH